MVIKKSYINSHEANLSVFSLFLLSLFSIFFGYLFSDLFLVWEVDFFWKFFIH